MKVDRSTYPQMGFYHCHLQTALHCPHVPITQGPACQAPQHHWLSCWQNNHHRKSCSKAHSLSRQALSCSDSNPLPPRARHSHSTAERVRSEERREGKSVSVRVDLGGRRIIKKKKIK